jgi:zinc protease
MKKLALPLLLGLAAAAALPSHAAAPTTAKSTVFDRKAYSIDHKKFVLPNGLTLLVHTDKSVPVVGVNMWYHVGSRNEKRGKTGFAHLFEHFFFNGSENYPHGFREAMDDLGANNRNGTTNTDRTNFFEDVPVSALERTLFLESDRMGFLGNYISKEMLERERGVVQNEKRQGENQPYGRVRMEVSSKMYPYSHPYSWSTIGSMEDLQAASLDDIKEWYRTYYGPNNAVISLAGDITPERAYELVNKYFGAIPPGPPLPRTEKWIPQLDRNIRDEMEDHVPQVRIYRSWHTSSWKDADTQRLNLLAGVLAGSKTARLDKRLVYEKGMATGVSAYVNDAELGGTFNLSVTVKPGVDPMEVEREMERVVAELLEKGPTEAELKRVKTRELADFARSLERVGGMGGRSDVLAESQTYGDKPDAYLDRLELFATSSPADVKLAANRWLRANHYTMTVRPSAKLAATKSTLDRKQLPGLGDAPDVKFPTLQRAQLKNGLKVVLLERHTAPIVNVSLAVDAGAASDTTAKAGAASLALDLLDKGTRNRDAFALSDALENLGARLNTGTGQDQSRGGGPGPPPHPPPTPAPEGPLHRRPPPAGARAPNPGRGPHPRPRPGPVAGAPAGDQRQPRAFARADGRSRVDPGLPARPVRALEEPPHRRHWPGKGAAEQPGPAPGTLGAVRCRARLRQAGVRLRGQRAKPDPRRPGRMARHLVQAGQRHHRRRR